MKKNQKKVTVVPSYILLKENEKLTGISKDTHNRAQKGTRKVLVYICEDKLKNHLFLCQKISHIADIINSCIAQDNPEHVSVAALYQSMIHPREKTLGWVKMRWKVHPIELDHAAGVYESMRTSGFRNCTVLGTPEKYEVQCV